MENELIRQISHKGVNCLFRFFSENVYDSLDKKKMILGMEILIINLSKAVIIYGSSFLLGDVFKTLIMNLSFILTKRFSFGLHAKSSTMCTSYCLLVFVLLPTLVKYVQMNNSFTLSIFMIIIVLHYKYSPADTQARPLLGVRNRKRLKKLSLICVAILMSVSLLIPNNEIKSLIVMGSVCQTFSILPVTDKLLKRSERNYEKFEM